MLLVLLKIIHVVYAILKVFGIELPNNKSSEKLISDRYKFIWIAIPHSGRSSLLHLFIKNFNEGEDFMISRKPLCELLGKDPKYKKYFKFAVIRDPWSRVVSCYNKKIMNATHLKKLLLIGRYPALNPDMSFRDFVSWLDTEDGSDENADKHWISPHKLILDEKGEIDCDYIIRLEDLDQELSVVFDKLGIPFKRRMLKAKSTSKGMPKKPLYQKYCNYYDEETKKIVAKRYDEYIQIFGFGFPDK